MKLQFQLGSLFDGVQQSSIEAYHCQFKKVCFTPMAVVRQPWEAIRTATRGTRMAGPKELTA